MKSKSSRLFLISIISNLVGLLSILTMTLISIAISDPGYIITGYILSDIIFTPIMYAAYIFRVAQMNSVIFIKGDSVTKWFMQKTYLRFLLIISVVSLVLGSVVTILLWEGGAAKNYSAVITVIMGCNFLANYLWVINGIKLMSKKKLAKELKQEVLVLSIVWTLLNAIFHFLLMKSNEFFACVCILVGRNVLTLFVSFMLPIIKGLHRRFTPYGETRKCVSNVELALTTPSAFLVFLKYIKYARGDAGRNVIMLYSQIKRFEDISANRENGEEIIELATSIEHDYLIDQAEFRVQGIPNEVRQHISMKLQNLGMYLDSHLFDSLYGVVINILKRYFEEFKRSYEWQILLIRLRNSEMIYERMIKADLL